MLKRMFVCIAILAVISLASPAVSPALGQATPPLAIYIAPAVEIPDDYVLPATEPFDLSNGAPQAAGSKAVVILGTDTPQFQPYMENAAAFLRDNDVQVSAFYSTEDDFGWSDIVQAATGASYLIYAGHGVGSGDHPTKLGTFYLGPGDGEFVGPEAVRQELADRLAGDAVVIFTHACYTAGSPGDISQEEAQRRVALYAEPFVDIGVRAYFANNYYNNSNYTNAATWISSAILEARETGATLGDVFKGVQPNDPTRFRDIDYPSEGYDLWLNGEMGDWNYAFVGQPTYTFSDPELGGIPAELTYTSNQATGVLSPEYYTVTPANVGNSDPLTWTITTGCDWLDFSPETATTPEPFGVIPNPTMIAALPEGEHTGAFTVTVTDPAETLNAVQRVEVTLDIVTPRLGNLPAELNFTYLISDALMLPQSHVVTPRNVGSDDVLTWELERAGAWFETSVTGGTTPDAFTLTPISYTTTQSMSYTGYVTVTATAPIGTDDAVQRINLTLQVKAVEAARVFLPLVTRN